MSYLTPKRLTQQPPNNQIRADSTCGLVHPWRPRASRGLAPPPLGWSPRRPSSSPAAPARPSGPSAGATWTGSRGASPPARPYGTHGGAPTTGSSRSPSRPAAPPSASNAATISSGGLTLPPAPPPTGPARLTRSWGSGGSGGRSPWISPGIGLGFGFASFSIDPFGHSFKTLMLLLDSFPQYRRELNGFLQTPLGRSVAVSSLSLTFTNRKHYLRFLDYYQCRILSQLS